MNAWKSRATTVATKTIKCAGQTIKPIVRKGVDVVNKYPEVGIFGGLGYMAGSVVDNTPIIGRLTGGNAKLLLGGVGAIYGYNKAMLRRSLQLAERRVHSIALGEVS